MHQFLALAPCFLGLLIILNPRTCAPAEWRMTWTCSACGRSSTPPSTLCLNPGTHTEHLQPLVATQGFQRSNPQRAPYKSKAQEEGELELGIGGSSCFGQRDIPGMLAPAFLPSSSLRKSIKQGATVVICPHFQSLLVMTVSRIISPICLSGTSGLGNRMTQHTSVIPFNDGGKLQGAIKDIQSIPFPLAPSSGHNID